MGRQTTHDYARFGMGPGVCTVPRTAPALDAEQEPVPPLRPHPQCAISGSARLAPLLSMRGRDAGSHDLQEFRQFPSGCMALPAFMVHTAAEHPPGQLDLRNPAGLGLDRPLPQLPGFTVFFIDSRSGVFGQRGSVRGPSPPARRFPCQARDTERTMSRENVEIVRRLFSYWGRGDWRSGGELLDPNCELVFSAGWFVDPGRYCAGDPLVVPADGDPE
jgi:hypothetical protein